MAVLNSVLALPRAPLGQRDYSNVGTPATATIFYTKTAPDRDERVKEIILYFLTPGGVLAQQFLQIGFNPTGTLFANMLISQTHLIAAPRGGELAVGTAYALIIREGGAESSEELKSAGWWRDANFNVLTVNHPPFMLEAGRGQLGIRMGPGPAITLAQVQVYSELL